MTPLLIFCPTFLPTSWEVLPDPIPAHVTLCLPLDHVLCPICWTRHISSLLMEVYQIYRRIRPNSTRSADSSAPIECKFAVVCRSP